MHTYHVGTATRDFGKSLELNMTAHQKSVLESAFAINCYPSAKTLNELAQQTKLDERTVSRWFCHKRSTIKLRKGEGTQSSSEYIRQ